MNNSWSDSQSSILVSTTTLTSQISVSTDPVGVEIIGTIDTPTNSLACEELWDGIYKWPVTPANTTIEVECSEIFAMVVGLGNENSNSNSDNCGSNGTTQAPVSKFFASRLCLANGHWASGNWTNYTECLNLLTQRENDTSSAFRAQTVISYIVLILLIASLVSLLLSLVIFISFKSLQCLRIRVHKNLCVALLMNCCLFIIMNSLVGIHRLDLSVEANWFCKMLKALNVYSSMATINWMFVEGFLFHRRLLTPFSHNTKAYSFAYYFVGWILPAICVGTWSFSLEFFSIVADKPCWQGYRHSNTIFIVSTPMIVAVIFNFAFLINIIRILVTKLRSASNKSEHATVKAIKATALLIPLLGIHHLIVLYNPSTFNRKLVNVYIILNVLFQSIQGIIVSVLYCFTNNEVRQVLNSAWSRRRLSHQFFSGENSFFGKGRRSMAVGSFCSLNNNNNNNHNNNNNNGSLLTPDCKSNESLPVFVKQSSSMNDAPAPAAATESGRDTSKINNNDINEHHSTSVDDRVEIDIDINTHSHLPSSCHRLLTPNTNAANNHDDANSDDNDADLNEQSCDYPSDSSLANPSTLRQSSVPQVNFVTDL